MDATVAAGWIGAGAAFVGTVVGAGVSVWATVLTQRHEARTALVQKQEAAEKQVEERGRAAGNDALTELYALRRHILRWGPDLDVESRASWTRSGEELADQVEIATGLIPQAQEVRTRMEEALSVAVSYMHEDENRPATQAYGTKRAVDHAIDILQTFLRGDPLPRISYDVDTLRIERAEYRRENPLDPDED
jgi:hypothetical protein